MVGVRLAFLDVGVEQALIDDFRQQFEVAEIVDARLPVLEDEAKRVFLQVAVHDAVVQLQRDFEFHLVKVQIVGWRLDGVWGLGGGGEDRHE